jgi:hypothetical protein
MAMLLRRAGNRADAGALWGRIWKVAGSDAAGLEFAKYLEHDERRFEAAREVVRALHGRCADTTKREALRHRLNRLNRKLGDV